MQISWFAFWSDKLVALGIVVMGMYLLWKKRRDFRVKLVALFLASFMSLFLAIRLILFLAFYQFFSSLKPLDLLYAFIKGIQFDLCASATLSGALIVAALLSVKKKNYYRLLAGIGALIWAMTCVICVGDLIYFSFVKRHTGTEILLAIYDIDLLASLASMQYLWVILVLVLIGGMLLWGSIYLAGKMYKTPNKLNWKDALCVLCCILMLFFAFRGRFGFRFKPLTIQEAYTDGNMARGNLALNGAFCIYKSIFKKYAPVSKLVDSEEALKRAKQLLGSSQEKFINKDYPLLRQRQVFNVDGQNFNVVIIVVESWQYRYTDGFAGTNYMATPHLDELAKKGVLFKNFYASGQRSINGNGTIMSGVAQIQGLPYFSLGLEEYHFTGLANLLNQAGYRTIFAQPTDWNSARVGMVAQITGFKEIYARPDMQSLGEYVKPGFISDYDGLMLLSDKLKDEERPFFALFFTAAMHPPFSAIHKDFERFPWDGEDKGYLNILSYTDWAIGEFIKKMKQQEQYDKTIFIVVADHTLGWGESGSFEDRFHIPLLIHAPALFAAYEENEIGSQSDIMPTVLDILHVSEPYAAMGNSLFDKQAEHFAFTSQDGRVLGWLHNGDLVEHTGTTIVKTTDEKESSLEEVRNLLGLNRAVYEALKADKWAPSQKSHKDLIF